LKSNVPASGEIASVPWPLLRAERERLRTNELAREVLLSRTGLGRPRRLVIR
jgi:hypothetical protein